MKKTALDRKVVVQELIDRFWILKKDDPDIYYQVREMEFELRRFFSDTFRYGLVVTHEIVKLEKMPTSIYEWLGVHKGPDFSNHRDYVFLFLLLAFLEGKGNDQQFVLQEICLMISASYPGEKQITWKQGLGYRNRLSLIRVLKYAVKMRLIEMVDKELDDFSSNGEHDVLMQKTPFLPYFLRTVPFDVRKWKSVDDIQQHFTDMARVGTEHSHTVFRKLFMEPILYLDELPEEEAQYIKNYGRYIEDHVEKHTQYTVERFYNAILLVKHENKIRETLYPVDDNMMHKFVLSFCGRVKADLSIETVLEQFHRNIDIPFQVVDQLINEMRKEDGSKWTREFGEKTTSDLRGILIQFLEQWKFGSQVGNFTLRLREGAFRVIGAYEA